MQVHQLKPTHTKKRKKRIGRGGKRGVYSGRGMKGQKSRAGTRKIQPIIRELIKRYPKLRGYRNKPLGKIALVISLADLEKNFKKGDVVNPSVLFKKGYLGKIKGEAGQVKILANGELKKELIIEGCAVSKAAKEKIEKAGGRIVK